jgi:hypothetical protein
MKIFDGIPPNAGHQSIHQGFKAVVERARRVMDGKPEWALFEMGIDREDSQWLYDWAKNLQPEVVRHWLGNGQPPDNAETQEKYAAAFGILLTLLAVENARVGLPQSNDWPLPVSLQYAAAARPALFNGDDPLPEQLRAIQLAIKRLRLRCGFSSDPRQWLRETIALQINPADETEEDLPRWIRETIALMEEHRRRQTPAPVAQTPAQPVVVRSPHSRAADAYDGDSTDDIFGPLDARPGVATIEEAACAMLDRARARSLLPGPWSLAELVPTVYDYIWLRVWVTKLDESTVHYCSSPFRRFAWDGQEYPLQAAFGLLLMLWISEHARRQAEEGVLWRWIPQEALPQAAGKVLFAQKQPSATIKELLEMAARRFNLRHVFGRAGAQQWIDTIFLQFGFTRRGFERRLPEWLAGQTPTQAIEQLLATETGSASFRDCWETLRNHRLRNITFDRAVKNLAATPWLLPEWTARVLEIAREPVARTASSAQPSQAEAETAEDTFLSEPLLRWEPPAAPYFLCRLIRLDLLELTEDVYHVTVNGRVETQLLRQNDGSYAAADGDETKLPCETARVAVQLVDSAGQIAAAEDLELWPAGEDVTVFQLSNGRLNDGRRLADAYAQPMSMRADYAVLTAPDLRLEPQPANYHITSEARLFFLRGGWSAQTRVWLGDALFWEPCFQQERVSQPPTVPAWQRSLRLEIDATAANRPLRWGDRIHLRLFHPPEAEVRFARHRGGPLDFERRDDRCTRIGPLTLTPENGTGDLELQLGIRYQNQLHRIKREAAADLIGVAKLKNGVWKALPERFVLKSETARTARFKIAPPRKWDEQKRELSEWAMMEGDLWLKRLSRQHAPIGEVTGLGAPLTLRLGPYYADRDAMTIAESVIDCGVVEQVWKAEGQLHLRLLRPVEASERHFVIYWSEDGQLHQLLPTPSETGSNPIWRCALPEGTPEFVAVALMYEGWRLGAWWQKDWHCHLESLAEASPRATATLLRWFRLPLLSEKALASVREVAHRHPAEFLPIWLQQGADSSFNLPAVTEGWLAAVRVIFSDWTPDAPTAESLLNVISESAAPEEAFHRAASQLLEADPRLLYKVLIAWLSGQSDRQTALNKIRSLRLNIAEAKDETDYHRLRQKLLAECAAEWNVDSYFIDNGRDNGIVNHAITSVRGEKLLRRDEMNIALAISSESLRRLLAMSLLKIIA